MLFHLVRKRTRSRIECDICMKSLIESYSVYLIYFSDCSETLQYIYVLLLLFLKKKLNKLFHFIHNSLFCPLALQVKTNILT
jgi:hypothetical protein